mgnify:FL=1
MCGMITKSELMALKKARRHGIGRLLALARRDFMSRLAKKMEHKGGARLTRSSRDLVQHIDLEGTRSTELARRLGISKQAVGKTIKELEEIGLLKRVPDCADGRAFLVSFTDAGVEFLLEGHKAIKQIERNYEDQVGAEAMSALRAALGAIAYPARGDKD